MAKEKCGLKGCDNILGPGSASVGYESSRGLAEIRVCPQDAWKIMIAPRGTYRITDDCKLERIPAKPIIIT